MINTDSEGGMKSAHQYSQSSQGVKDSGKRMNTIQQKNTQDKNMTRARSKDKMSANNLNTISHPPQRKSSQPPSKAPKGPHKPNSIAAQAMMQNQMLQPKQQLNVKMINSREGSKQRTGTSSGAAVVLHTDAPPSGGNLSAQGQGQGQVASSQQNSRQQMNSMLGQPNQRIGGRGTTPLRLNKQNTQKSGTQQNSVTGLNPSSSSQGMMNKGSSGQLNRKAQNQGGNQQNKIKSSNNQQIKGIMAAALASVKDNNQVQGAILPAGIIRSGQSNGEMEPQILNQMQSYGSQQDGGSNENYDQNYLNFADPNELMILKANSVNQKYMTEQIQNQKITVEDMIDPVTGQIIQNTAGDADYIDTEDEEAQIIHKNNNLKIQQIQSSPLRRPKHAQKSQERKVFSQQDFQEDYKYGYEKENQPKQFKNSAGSRQRGRSTNQGNPRPQIINEKQAFSMERNLASNSHQISVQNNTQAESNLMYNARSSNTVQKPKNSVVSPTQNQMQFEFDPNHQILQTQSHLLQYQSVNNDNQSALNQKVEKLSDQYGKFEVSQSQLTQRLDIFEEEIIKRVREIQKYSKGLNSLLRKNVMPDLALTVDKVAKIEQGELPKQKPKIDTNVINQDEEMRQLEDKINEMQMQIAQQETIIQNMQINIETDINTRCNLIELKIEDLPQQQPSQRQSGGDNPEIQQKLVEQNQLITMLDEQVSEQEQQIQQIQSSLQEIQQNTSGQKSQSPARQENNQVQFEGMESIQEKINDLEKQCLRNSEEIQKQQEDSEGRDGLMLKLNEDITNLFQTQEQVMGNEKQIKEGFECLELKIQEVQQSFEAQQQEGVTKEIVETMMVQSQEQISNQIQQMNLPAVDQSQEAINDQVMAHVEGFEKKVNDVMLIHEGLQNQFQQLLGQIEQAQSETENLVESNEKRTHDALQSINQNLQNLQEGSQQLELQFQAQIDEQNASQDTRLKKLEVQIQPQRSDQPEKKESEDTSIAKTDFDSLTQQFNELSSHFEELSQSVKSLESKDIFTIIEANSINPINQKIEDLTLEINMKNQELNEHQDSQINQLITRIKQMQDNFEDLQNLVNEVDKDVDGLKKSGGGDNEGNKVGDEEVRELTEAVTILKIDSEKFKEQIENKLLIIQKAQADDNSQQLQLIQKNREDIQTMLQSQQQEIQSVQSSVSQELTLVKSSVVQELETVKVQPPPQQETEKSDIERIERQIAEIEIQVKNIYKENTNEFNEIKKHQESMAVFEKSSKDNSKDTNDHIEKVKEELTQMFNANFQTILKDIDAVRNTPQPERASNVSIGDNSQQISEMQKQIKDLSESIGAVQKSFEILATMMPQIQQMQKQIQSLNTEPVDLSAQDEKIKAIENEIKEQSNVVKRSEKSLLAKIDLNSMDIKSIQGQGKQIEFLKSEFRDIEQKVQTIESQQSDVQTMKHLVDIMQDSNFGAQIDELRTRIQNYSQNRHSLPQMTTQSQKTIEHEEFEMQNSSKKKKVEPVKSMNPALQKKSTEPILKKTEDIEMRQKSQRDSKDGSIKIQNNLKSKPDIDLSSINSKGKNKIHEQRSESDGQKKEDIFSGTDQDLQNNLKHLFQNAQDGGSRPSDIQFQEDFKRLSQIQVESITKDEVPASEPFEQASPLKQQNQENFDQPEDDSINRDSKFESNKDFGSSQQETSMQKEDHEKLYSQEVKLPILQEENQENTTSFKNSSKVETQEQIQRDSIPNSQQSSLQKEPVSIGSINLVPELTEEQKNKIAHDIMLVIDMEQIYKDSIDQIFEEINANIKDQSNNESKDLFNKESPGKISNLEYNKDEDQIEVDDDDYSNDFDDDFD